MQANQATGPRRRWRSADLAIDVGTRQVFRDGEDLAVPGLSFDLLLTLVENAPDLVSADELMDRVWSGQVVSPETVSQRVKLLRQALGDDPRNPRYIALVRGHGWRWVAPVDGDDAVRKPTSPVASRRIGRIAVLATLVLGLAWFTFLGDHSEPPLPAPDPSIAVLPFDNRSDHPDDLWLTEGIHDEILLELSRIPGLRVISRTSVQPYRETRLPVTEIARALDVGLVLEGAMQRVGDDLRLTLQLIDGSDDRHLWAERFDRPLDPDNLLTMQREISRAVVDKLQLALLPRQREHSPLTTEGGAGVYQAYLEGWQALEMHTAQGIEQAIESFERALAIDPDFALGWVGLAEARLMQWRYRFLHPSVAARLADAPIERALALEPELPEAIAARAEFLWMNGDWQAAEEQFRRAIALKPNFARAYVRYGFMLLLNPADHRPTEAINLWRTAARIDPHSHVVRQHLAWTEFRAGRFGRAERALRAVLDEYPDYPVAWFVLGEVLGAAGDQAGAVAAYRRALELNPNITPLANYGLVEALMDLEKDEAAWLALEDARAVPGAPELALRLEFKLIVQSGEPEPDLQRARTILSEMFENPAAVNHYYEIDAFHQATLELLEGRPDAARQVMESLEPRLAEQPGTLPRDGFWRPLFCTQAHAMVATGEVDSGRALARWFLNQLELSTDAARRHHIEPIVCNAVLGHHDQAIDLLQAAAEAGVPSGWRFLAIRPELDSLRADPRFSDLIAAIKTTAAQQRSYLTDIEKKPDLVRRGCNPDLL